MLFRKNVSRKEQMVRVVAGLGMILGGLFGLQASSVGWIVAVSGLASLVTGLVRYCPACAIAGKKSC